MSTLSELKEEVARLKKLKEEIKSRKENEANQIKAKTKGLEIFFDEFKEKHNIFYQQAFISSTIAYDENLPKIENIYALTFDIVFKLSLFIAFRLDDKNILKDNDYLFAMLFKKHFNCDYWTENNKLISEAKKDFEEHIKKYSVFLICKNTNEIENLKKPINPILELFCDFCHKTLKRKSFKKNDIDFNNFMSGSEINDNKSIDIDEYVKETNDFNCKISKKLNLINNDGEWNNVLKSVRLFIEPLVVNTGINICFNYVSELWSRLEKGIFYFLKIKLCLLM